MGNSPSLTWETRKILRVLLDARQGEHYGLELARAAGLPSGSIYPILARLEKSGWLLSAWEDIDPAKEGRRPRRYYRLTAAGVVGARKAIAEVQRFFSLHPERSRA